MSWVEIVEKGGLVRLVNLDNVVLIDDKATGCRLWTDEENAIIVEEPSYNEIKSIVLLKNSPYGD